MNALDYVIAGAGSLIVLSAVGTAGYVLIAATIRRLARRCHCGHTATAHDHYRSGSDCAICDCERLSPTSYRYGDVDATWPQSRMPQQQVDRLCADIFALEGLN